jgi:hypothetical protein
MVSHVASPAMISVRTVDPRSEILKNRSSPVGATVLAIRTPLSTDPGPPPEPNRMGKALEA